VSIILDTNAFLWWVLDDPKLSPRARMAIAENPELFVSAVSAIEVAIKMSLGRLPGMHNLRATWDRQLSLQGMVELPIFARHGLRLEQLPRIHRDPFDRLLVAQAQMEQMPIVTSDRIFVEYGVEVIW
jgi:PIN domain nuclease of toxin-antitoxin system